MDNKQSALILLVMIVIIAFTVPMFFGDSKIPFVSGVILQSVFCQVNVAGQPLMVCHNANDTIHIVTGPGIGITTNGTTNTMNITSIGGADNQGTNVGAGGQVYKNNVGINLVFRSLVGGNKISVTQNTNDLTLAFTGVLPSSQSCSVGFSITAYNASSGVYTCSANSLNGFKANNFSCSAGSFASAFNNSTGTYTCTSVSGFLTSLDGDTTAAQVLAAGQGLSLVEAGATHTFKTNFKVNTQTCVSGRFSSFSNVTGNFVCTGGTGGVTSINSDSSAAQTLAGTPGNVTVTDAGATHTFNTGSNVVITGGQAQTITKSFTINSLTLGGNAVGGSNSFIGLNHLNATKVFQNGLQVIDTLTAGTGISISGSGNSRTITNTVIDTDTNTAQIKNADGANYGLFGSRTNATQNTIKSIGAGSGIGLSDNGTHITISNNGVTSLAGTTNNVTVSASTGAITLNLGSNVVTTGLSAQTISKALTFSSGLIMSSSDITLGSNALTTSGHKSTLPSTTGTLCQTNQTAACGGSDGITSINSDTTAAQTLAGTANNVTILDSGATHTFGLGSNVIITGGSAQTISKGITLNALTLGGNVIGNNKNITGINNLNATKIFQGTSQLIDTIQGTTGNTTTSKSGGTVTTNLSYNAVVTGGSAQTFTKNLDLGYAQTDKFANTGIIIRNPTTTFATTLSGGAVTANRTLNLPAITGTDTLASLGLAQTFTALNTFNGGATISGLSTKIVTKTADYTATVNDDTVLADATSNWVTITLPAASNSGKIIMVKRIDTAQKEVIVKGGGSDTIDGNATRQLYNLEHFVILQADGTSNWKVIGQNERASYHMYGTARNIWVSFMPTTITTNTGAITANRLWALPFYVPTTVKNDKMEFEVTTNVAGHCRTAIYTSNSTLYPDNLITGTDQLASPNSTAVVSTTFTSTVTLYGGNYYFHTIICDVGASFREIGTNNYDPVLGIPSTMGSSANNFFYTATLTYPVSGLPSTYPTGATFVNSQGVLLLHRLIG